MAGYVKIGADGIDAAALVETIRRRAAERVKNGEFDLDALARAERYNLDTIKDNSEFFLRYIDGLRQISEVHINDYDIIERRKSLVAPLLVRLKKGIWALLRFYTYHLWSQQNRTNGLFQAGLSLVAERGDEQVSRLQARVDELEKRLAALEAQKGK
jgi:hypothetical protein